MTDEQIIKALRYCNGGYCENCKALDFCDYQHAGRLASCAYVVINRQKAKIENEIKEIKSEAIKEFAERLKKYLCLDLREGISVVTIDNIDKIVKEMIDKE